MKRRTDDRGNARPRCPARASGFALFTVTVFVFIVILVGLGFFALASYETKAALYREESSESFYLADGAVERARARFLDDRSWRDGWSGEAAGRGTYDLTVQDTVYQGADVVRLVATGHVGSASRRVEVLADLPPTAFDLVMLIMGDATVRGNLCMPGSAHINGGADFGNNDVHLHCDGRYTTGFHISPPPIFTDPAHFPDATYYYVRGHTIGSTDQARIFDRDLNDITTLVGDSLVGLVDYNAGRREYTFEFKNGDLEAYFDDSTGVFSKAPGDVAVVVNFGEALGNPADVKSNVYINDDGTIRSTIINTRFTAIADSLRLDKDYWFGGSIEMKKATFEPRYGIALIPHTLMASPGASNLTMGTEAWPALVYATGDVDFGNANFELRGSLIVLGDYRSTGGPDLVYDGGFLENLPGYLADEWLPDVSGTLKIVRWRELAMN